MNKIHLILIMTLVVIFGSALTQPAVADLQVRDDAVFGVKAIVYDSATGLEWLRLPLSGTKSYNDMIGVDGTNEFAAGRKFAGFRYATMTEVKQLWIHAGISAEYFFYGLDAEGHNIGTYSTNNSTAFNAGRTLQNLLGYTLTKAYPPYTNAGGWETKGLAKDPGGIGFPNLSTCTVGTGFCGGSSLPMLRAHLSGVHPTSWQPLIGYHHWLVRTPQKPPIIRKTMPLKQRLQPH
ncbi:MAG: hypothetical protein JW902_19520 [Syntrophaceae bacterium]|nr:hypothetical protein [Syntrophaceae bacterium]